MKREAVAVAAEKYILSDVTSFLQDMIRYGISKVGDDQNV